MGTGAGVHAREEAGVASGGASRNFAIVATPAMPSAMAWCLSQTGPPVGPAAR